MLNDIIDVNMSAIHEAEEILNNKLRSGATIITRSEFLEALGFEVNVSAIDIAWILPEETEKSEACSILTLY